VAEELSWATATDDVVGATREVAEAFRSECRRRGWDEHRRTTVVSRHDPSIRFTNSTISVFKPLIESEVTSRYFLIQPALRLRNLSHVRRTGTMSDFGCAFLAFGALAPTGDAGTLLDLALSTLAACRVPQDRVRVNVHAADVDLRTIVRSSGARPAVHEAARGPFLHRFGIPEIAGRNINLAVLSPQGWADVANVIIIERTGEPVGVELAVGTNMILRQRDNMPHSVLSGPAALATRHGISDLVAIDALHSAVVLAADRLTPVSRGRGGNFRQFLKLLATRTGEGRAGVGREALAAAAHDVAGGELAIRDSASPPGPEVPAVEAQAVAGSVMTSMDQVATTAPASTVRTSTS
jgi:hypothetical protein